MRERTKEWAMIVIVKVWSTNPDYSAGCDYAVVEISEDFAKVMLRRIGVLSEQKVLDPAVCETYYWDSSPQYFSPWIDRACESQPREVQATCIELDNTLADLEVDTCEVVTAPDDFRVLDSQIAAVECSQMIVRDGGIAFTAIPKHTGIYLTTAEIPKQVLESALTTATA
jgi:hypothetical protein